MITSVRNQKNRIALKLGYRSWKHLLDVSDRGYVFNLSRYPNLRQLFKRYDIPYFVKGERMKTGE